MARIDYFGILKATQDVLSADADLRNLRATVEIARAVVTTATSPHINIHEGRREDTRQALAAGTRQRYVFRWGIVVSVFSAKGAEDAMQQRDEVLGVVETVLMGNRNLGGKLADKQMLLRGGELRSEPGDNGWWSQGRIDLATEVVATI